MKPLATCRWVILESGRPVVPKRWYYMYITCDGVALERRDGRRPPIVFAWDEIRNVTCATGAGTEGVRLAEEFDQ